MNAEKLFAFNSRNPAFVAGFQLAYLNFLNNLSYTPTCWKLVSTLDSCNSKNQRQTPNYLFLT